MKTKKAWLVGLAVLAAAGLFIFNSPVAYASSGQSGTWSAASSPDPSDFDGGTLAAVSCASAKSCQAVGYYTSTGGETLRYPLIEDYDGTGWTLASVPLPSDYFTSTGFGAVSCVSATFCQAVGSYQTAPTTAIRPLVESFNGTSWHLETTPEPADLGDNDYFSAVSCTSATFCQAVGSYTSTDAGNPVRPLMETFNGSTWHVATNPLPSDYVNSGRLSAVACTSASFCQAVGSYQTTGAGNPTRALIESYTGTSWSVATSPDPVDFHGYAVFISVSCATATSCRAVGTYQDVNGVERALIDDYNGSSWSVATNTDPSDLANNAVLEKVSCASATACQAVGIYEDTNGIQRPLIETYTGTSWIVATSAVPGDFANGGALLGVSCASATFCQAVGLYQSTDAGGPTRILIESYDGTSWSVATVAGSSDLGDNVAVGDVTCASATSCQAVGAYEDTNGIAQVLIETYVGTSAAPSGPTGATPAPTLAVTGTDAAVPFTAALLLVLIGAGLVTRQRGQLSRL